MNTADRSRRVGFHPFSWNLPQGWAARDLVRVPGLLSLSRLVLAGLFPLTIGHPAWSLAVLATSGATDVLDGWYARRFHQQSETGAVLDAFTDKVFVVAVVVTLVASGSMRLIEALLLSTRDFGEVALVAWLALAGRSRQLKAPHHSNVGGKVATMLQYVAVVAIILGASARAIWIGAAALAGVLASVSYWRRDVPREPMNDAAPPSMAGGKK